MSASEEKAIDALRNFGPKSKGWLAAVGINTEADLRAVGVEESFARMAAAGFPVNAIMLYAMEAALIGIDWREVPPPRREELKILAKEIKARVGR